MWHETAFCLDSNVFVSINDETSLLTFFLSCYNHCFKKFAAKFSGLVADLSKKMKYFLV